MAKAWRNIESNNGKRPPPQARIKAGSNWLLSGLMIHAGYMPAVPNAGTAEVPITMGLARRISRAVSRWWTGKR